MRYSKLGRTGLKVSKISLGTANFGKGTSSGVNDWGVVNEKDAFEIMDYALDVGINFFDTANVYGGLNNRGLTETIVGNWFHQGGNRRERVILGTKVGRTFEQSIIDGPNNVEGLSLYKIRRHLEASLKRLQTDKIEIYTMHKSDLTVGWEEIWEAFEGAVRSGKVDYIGSSNHSSWEIMKAQEGARKRNFMGIVCEQHLYNPLNRIGEHELLPMALDQGIGVTLYSPLFRGLLGIDAFNLDKRPMTAEAKLFIQTYRATCEAFSKLCREIGEEEANVTLAWELSHPAVTSVIVAPCSISDLKSMLKAVEITLDASVMSRMDEIFPPYSTASPYFTK
ncbi:MAG TPA: aldo/keto reductase [Clostridiaceae bacterium]